MIDELLDTNIVSWKLSLFRSRQKIHSSSRARCLGVTMASTAGVAAAVRPHILPQVHCRARRRSTRIRASGTEVEEPEQGTMVGNTALDRPEVPLMLGVTLLRYAGSGAAMLRNGGAAVRHHVAVARGKSGTRPLSWSPGMTVGVELLAGFLEGISIDDEEVAAVRFRQNKSTGTDDQKSADRLLVYLQSLRAMMAVGVPPLPGTRVQRVTIGADDIPAVWLTPNLYSWNNRRAPKRVLLWFHGGAFVLCNTATHARLLSSMGVAADARVLSVEYPLAPDQGTYENMADAVDRAYEWLCSPDGGNVLPENVVIGGDSAGGHLACGLAQRLSKRSEKSPRPPAGVVLLSPWLDPGRERDSTKTAWANASERSVDYLRGVEGSMSRVVKLVFGETEDDSCEKCLLDASLYAGRSMPPCLVQCGGVEVLASESRTLADLADETGWELTLEAFEGMPHVFQVFDSVTPQGGDAIESVGRFIKRLT